MFEQLIMQVVQESFASSATNLIIAVTGLVAAIGSGIGAVAVYAKSKGYSHKALDVAIQAGQVSQVANQKANEAKDRIHTGLDAFYQLAPEDQKAILSKSMPDLDKLAVEIKTGNAQVDRINSIIPEFNAKKLDIPREDFETKPTA